MMNNFEAIQYPFSFWWTYLMGMSFVFKAGENRFEDIQAQVIKENLVSPGKRYGQLQKSAIFWGPIVTISIYLLSFFVEKMEINDPLRMIALVFFVISLFMAHVPDYIICLPQWLSLRRKIVKNPGQGKKPLRDFEKSILFRYEPLFFRLPGLPQMMTSFAENRSIGVREAAKQISHIYRSTFQQIQAQRAVENLAKNKTMTHALFLSLLEFNGLPLVKKLAKKNTLAEIYMGLFEEEQDLQSACQRLEKEEGYGLNREMVIILQAAHGFIAAAALKDIETACTVLEKIKEFPNEAGFFAFFEKIAPQLGKVKDALLKIGTVERLETRRAVLSDQRENLEELLKSVHRDLFEPFKNIWEQALEQGIEIMGKEIEILRGSASLTIALKNKEIFTSGAAQNLYFEVHNKGSEMAFDVSLALSAAGGPVALAEAGGKEIAVIEPGVSKEISRPITANAIGKSMVKGTVTFSDRAGENKQVEFSFPVSVKARRTRFKKINNPYIVGQPLKGDAPYYFGREDAYEFIDKNIMVGRESHNIVCHGLRRTGKTSILYRIESKGFTDKRLVPVNLDIQGIADEKDFFHSLAAEIREKLSLSTGATVNDFGAFKGFLKEIEPVLGERIIVLMIDEFEELQMRVEDGRISRTIFSNLRHLMQHEEKLVFLFCGTHKLEEMSADYWSIFFNTALYLKISHLKRKDAIGLIIEPVKGQLNYDDLAVEQILKMTAGQPYLVQLLCRTLVNDLNENKKRNHALIDDVDEAVETIIANDQDYFSQNIWKESTLLEKLVLSATAEELTLKQMERTGLEPVYERIQTVTSKFARKDVLGALDRLAAKEILVEKNERYSFPVNLLRKWISARWPLRKIRDEID